MSDQIEIIGPNADVKFYELDAAKGITNIGRHPENDIVINNPKIALFHAMLDHRQKPYQLVVMSGDGNTRIGGEGLPPNTTRELHNWDALEIENYTLILVEAEYAYTTPSAPTLPTGGVAPMPARGVAAAPVVPVIGVPVVSAPTRPSNPLPSKEGLKKGMEGLPFAPVVLLPTQPTAPAAPSSPRGDVLMLQPGAPASPPPATPVAAPADGVAALPAPTPSALVPTRLTRMPPDIDSEYILIELTEREHAVEVEQPAHYEFTVVNGGRLVANFDVRVDGLNPEWVEIEPREFNLNEGARHRVGITITPPRLPTSAAGKHHFAVVVTSPDYEGQACQRGMSVEINPFYNFNLSDLSPKTLNTHWSRTQGEAALTLTNRGNSFVRYQLQGEDDEQKCSFEFVRPGHDGTQSHGDVSARQTQISIQPNEQVTIPIHVYLKPRRRLFGREKHYSLTFTASSLTGAQVPRSVRGDLFNSALMGPWLIMLLLAALTLATAVIIVAIFRPWVEDFTVEGQKNVYIRANEAVTFKWKASPWAQLKIDNSVGSLDSNEGEKKFTPITTKDPDTIIYHLTSENWLTKLSTSFGPNPSEVRVTVGAVYPTMTFALMMPDNAVFIAPVTRTLQIYKGQKVVLSWEVTNAESWGLVTNNVAETLPANSFVGRREVAPDRDTTYLIEARNRYTTDSKRTSAPITVKVVDPPTPTPAILRFSVNPSVIVAGTPVALEWEVSNAPKVSIGAEGEVQPFGRDQSPKGSVNQSPTQRTVYVLDTSNGSDPFAVKATVVVEVTPPPTPTPTPQPPKILYARFSIKEVVRGDPAASAVQIQWAVEGATTRIQIKSPDLGEYGPLGPTGVLTVSVAKSTNFVLTAANGDLAVSQSDEIKVLEPTQTPTVTPTPTPPPTATPPPPPPQIVFFNVQLDETKTNPPNAVVIIGTDRYQVAVNSFIKVCWSVVNATKVTFQGIEQDVKLCVPIGPVLAGANYTLIAENAAGVKQTRTIVVTLKPQIPPPAPFNLNGRNNVGNTPPVTLTWNYDLTYLDQIVGFRVYRADAPGSNYARVADNLPKSDVASWVDNSSWCGKAYYVVAIYIDVVDGQRKETPRTSQTWYSRGCPPTPTPTKKP
jgi:hypothetical protein